MSDFIGRKFGFLTVIKRIENRGNYSCWLCKCDCGKYHETTRSHLVAGDCKSCTKCKLIFPFSDRKEPIFHNLSKTEEYKIWTSMITRCINTNRNNYHNYGGRGISVCEEWLNNFEQFYKDMGPRPSKKYSIERLDNDGNYCKDNCKWATKREQFNNRRVTRFETFNGVTLPRSEWAIILGLTYHTLRGRLDSGWSFDQICGYEPKDGKYYYAPNLCVEGKIK